MTDKPDPANQPAEPQPTAELPEPHPAAPQPTAELPNEPHPAAAQQPTAEVPSEPRPAAAQEPPAAEPSAAHPAAGQAAGQATPQPAYSRRPPHMTKTWIAAVAAAVLLVGGGIGGYAIGANDRHDHGPAWNQQRGPQDDFRDNGPHRGDGPWNR